MVRLAFLICSVLYGICAQTPTTMTEQELFTAQFGTTNSVTYPELQQCQEVCSECSNQQDYFSNSIKERSGSESTVDEKSCVCQCCGYRNEKDTSDVHTRILGATTLAEYHEFPWIVAILKEGLLYGIVTYDYKCVGSLIHPKVVLTVAHHITEKPNKFKIRAGRHNQQVNDTARYERQVSRIVIHEHYERRGLLNDIALLFLVDAYTIGANINTICLPPPNNIFDLQRCIVSGWGKDSFGKEGKYSQVLKTVELPIVPKDKCLTELRKAGVGHNYKLHDSFICAGGEPGVDTCEGDGGSPLACPIPNTSNQYHQVGMVSWGIGCGGPTPGGYVNIPLFTNWIKEQLEP